MQALKLIQCSNHYNIFSSHPTFRSSILRFQSLVLVFNKGKERDCYCPLPSTPPSNELPSASGQRCILLKFIDWTGLDWTALHSTVLTKCRQTTNNPPFSMIFKVGVVYFHDDSRELSVPWQRKYKLLWPWTAGPFYTGADVHPLAYRHCEQQSQIADWKTQKQARMFGCLVPGPFSLLYIL